MSSWKCFLSNENTTGYIRDKWCHLPTDGASMPRIKPGTRGWEAITPPLCYAATDLILKVWYLKSLITFASAITAFQLLEDPESGSITGDLKQ